MIDLEFGRGRGKRGRGRPWKDPGRSSKVGVVWIPLELLRRVELETVGASGAGISVEQCCRLAMEWAVEARAIPDEWRQQRQGVGSDVRVVVCARALRHLKAVTPYVSALQCELLRRWLDSRVAVTLSGGAHGTQRG